MKTQKNSSSVRNYLALSAVTDAITRRRTTANFDGAFQFGGGARSRGGHVGVDVDIVVDVVDVAGFTEPEDLRIAAR